jgi:hypothetical protein
MRLEALKKFSRTVFERVTKKKKRRNGNGKTPSQLQ